MQPERREKAKVEIAQLLAKIEEAKNMSLTFKGDSYKYTTRGKRTRWRKVFVVSKHMGLDARHRKVEQAENMKKKVNKMLRMVKGIDRETPFGYIEGAKNKGT